MIASSKWPLTTYVLGLPKTTAPVGSLHGPLQIQIWARFPPLRIASILHYSFLLWSLPRRNNSLKLRIYEEIKPTCKHPKTSDCRHEKKNNLCNRRELSRLVP